LIIACGISKGGFGTIDPLIWLLDLNVNPDSPWESPVKYEAIDAWIIPVRHPSNDPKPQITYEQLKGMIKKIPEELKLS